ncbi:hypothetical protein [Paenarthrobacter sp. YJN-5]|uniref:hypothetical protein n=1 Tax=Paenarthrobacter sp. YJN-5 TaxID=2735316 RepID=UPI001D0C677B|nr:hypothetical protein [Paenarthrobacter sp. YJN-5]
MKVRHIEGNALPVLTTPDARTSVAGGESPELLTVLTSMPMSDPEYGAWWDSEDGRWLYAEISDRIGGPLAASLRNKYGVTYEVADVANTAFTVLRQDFVHAYILRAEDPWAYLSQMLKREMLSAAGAHFRVELTDDALFASDVPTPSQPLVTVQEAASLTYDALAPLMPADLRDSLKHAIRYFAEPGGVRMSHLYTHATTDGELTSLGLVREEILAIANAVLGSRSAGGQNSLIAAFLHDPAFDPRTSILHRRALTKFQSRIAGAATKQEALVG